MPQWSRSIALALFILLSVPSAPLSVICLLEMEFSAEIFIYFIIFALFYLLRLSNLYYNDDNGDKVGSLFTDQLR